MLLWSLSRSANGNDFFNMCNEYSDQANEIRIVKEERMFWDIHGMLFLIFKDA